MTMGLRCVISNCAVSSSKNPDKFPFHEFPSNEEILQKWLASIPEELFRKIRGGRSGRSGVICGKHFLSQHYVPGTRRLDYKEAIPIAFERADECEPAALPPKKRLLLGMSTERL